MTSYLFDTCFLIDLQCEMRRSPGRAHQFLRANASIRPCLSWTVAGEFAEGFSDFQHPACTSMLSRFEMLEMNGSTADHYAQGARLLRAVGQLIGTNDLWIAAAAQAHAMPLVTNNAAHFSRLPGLAVIGY